MCLTSIMCFYNCLYTGKKQFFYHASIVITKDKLKLIKSQNAKLETEMLSLCPWPLIFLSNFFCLAFSLLSSRCCRASSMAASSPHTSIARRSTCNTRCHYTTNGSHHPPKPPSPVAQPATHAVITPLMVHISNCSTALQGITKNSTMTV